MNCFYHPDTTIVATCQDCRKGLCFSCSSQYNLPICRTCNGSRKSRESGTIRNDFIQVILLGLLFMLINFSIGGTRIYKETEPSFLIFSYLLLGYCGISLVVGWKTLNKVTPNYFLFLPIIGWVIYFAFKLYASILVGLFWTPFWFIRRINRLRQLSWIA